MRGVLVAAYRIRALLYAIGVGVILLTVLSGMLPAGELGRSVRLVITVVALAVIAISALLVMAGPRLLPVCEPRAVTSPVAGRWVGVNSPATKVPSHGIRLYGQAYAIDLVHDPVDTPRPEFGVGSGMPPAADYPAFGRPVHAMVDGTVVRIEDRQRDHRARASHAAVLYMLLEGAIRELGGPRFILGNHVIVRTSDGVFALVAHLRRGSVAVNVGDRVAAGDLIGACGNSGNSSEPHVHAQLMDRRSPWTAQGLPMVFTDITIDDGPITAGLPPTGHHMQS